MTNPAGIVFACTECLWHSIPGDYPDFGACPDCDADVVVCDCGDDAQ